MNYLILLCGLMLSFLAAFLSILGMQAIFPGSPLIIALIIGSIEISKYVSTTWLHANWDWLTLRYKISFSAIIFILMILTSMSIFGFFSKQHLENGLVSGDTQAKIEIINSKIDIEKQTIESSKKSIEQMNTVIDQVVSRSDKENSVIKANKIRVQQKQEKLELLKSIESANSNIQKLNEEKFPLEADSRKLEVEVGPLKYIASLLYDNVDSTILEKAVRYVIILMVIVFDPLAILLLVAFTLKKKETVIESPEVAEVKQEIIRPKINNDLLIKLDKTIRDNEGVDSSKYSVKPVNN